MLCAKHIGSTMQFIQKCPWFYQKDGQNTSNRLRSFSTMCPIYLRHFRHPNSKHFMASTDGQKDELLNTDQIAIFMFRWWE
jgi:hypothetical protein